MTGLQIIFLVNGLVTIFAALMMVTTRKLIHAALWLVLTLMGVAVVFSLMEAGFFVIIQVVIYIGAIAILILFTVMLTQDAFEGSTKRTRVWVPAAFVSLLVLAGILLALSTWPDITTSLLTQQDFGMDIGALGEALVDPQGYVIPFEVSSILLLAALVGAIHVAMERKGEKE